MGPESIETVDATALVSPIILQRVAHYIAAYHLPETEAQQVLLLVENRLNDLLQAKVALSLALAIQETQNIVNQWFVQHPPADPLLSIHATLLCWHRVDRITQATLLTSQSLPLADGVENLIHVAVQAVPPPKPQPVPVEPFRFWRPWYLPWQLLKATLHCGTHWSVRLWRWHSARKLP